MTDKSSTTQQLLSIAKSSPISNLRPLCHTVYILEPQAIVTDKNATNKDVQLSNEFGKSSACQDLHNTLMGIGYGNVVICPINLNNYKELIDKFASTKESFVVFNLCDGCESDGYPGISVLKELHARRIPYTGADPNFYEITTSKPVLKRYLQKENVPTSAFVEITPRTTAEELNALGSWPLIVKPSISYASISITEKSVVHDANEALAHAKHVTGVDDGVFVESFLAGREFTAFVSGSLQEGIRVYQVAERVFNPKLQKYQRILAFDKYWEGYDIDGSVPDTPNTVYWYAPAPEDIQEKLKSVAKRAFLAVQGSGYGRVDMRTESLESSDPLVLEVNANCGVSFNLNEFTSTVGEILRMSNDTADRFANDLIKFALERGKKNK